MQTVAVKLTAYDLAQGFRLLSAQEKLAFPDELHSAYKDNLQELTRDFEVMAYEAKGYSDESQKAVDVIRDAFNIAVVQRRITERQAF